MYGRLLVGIVLAVWLILTVERAWSCSCAPYPSDPKAAVRQAWDDNEAIFLGRVVDKRSLEGRDEPALVEATVIVQRLWKGPEGRTLRVRSARSGAACGVSFQRRRSYLIFADRESGRDTLATSLCSLTRPADRALAYVQALDAVASSDRLPRQRD